MKIYDLKDPIYRATLTVVITPDRDQFVHWLRKELGYNEEVDISGSRGWMCRISPENSDFDGVLHVLWLPKRDLTVLVHELAHLVMTVFHFTGIPMELQNTEAFAYYQQYWLDEVRKAWK